MISKMLIVTTVLATCNLFLSMHDGRLLVLSHRATNKCGNFDRFRVGKGSSEIIPEKCHATAAKIKLYEKRNKYVAALTTLLDDLIATSESRCTFSSTQPLWISAL